MFTFEEKVSHVPFMVSRDVVVVSLIIDTYSQCVCCFPIFQFRIFTAPFQHVGFADFWLADQLNSLAVALLDLQFIICFYAYDWHVSNGR